MVFRTSKRALNGGKMLKVSDYKANLVKSEAFDVNISATKREKIIAQVAKMREQIAICQKYQPFTSSPSKRRARQVGA